MPFEIFKFKGDTDPEEGGAPIGVIDLEDRSMEIHTKIPIKVLAAAYTFVAEDTGTFFKCTAALTLTLPAVSAAFKGCHLWVFVAADVTVVIAATADEMITFNDVDADQITWSTSSEKTGAAAHIICDGTAWMIMLMTEETQTTTVTT